MQLLKFTLKNTDMRNIHCIKLNIPLMSWYFMILIKTHTGKILAGNMSKRVMSGSLYGVVLWAI